MLSAFLLKELRLESTLGLMRMNICVVILTFVRRYIDQKMYAAGTILILAMDAGFLASMLEHSLFTKIIKSLL